MRGSGSHFEQPTFLPKISAWNLPGFFRPPKLAALQKRNGNVTISELGILAALASKCPNGSVLFEIGTFDGRTTLNLALNSGPDSRIVTLDLPKGTEPKFGLAKGEGHMVDKNSSGDLFLKSNYLGRAEQAKIRQKFGDSAQFDFSPYHSQCSLFFVDGSHSYDYAKADSFHALRSVAPSGMVVWHDYGVWEGVTRALEELASELELELLHIAGTSLVVWRRNDTLDLTREPNKTADSTATRATPPATSFQRR